ncbi:short transient receptor potential channel 4-like [Montipora capricornis]|uniref:short transient receptor potential channel 4-like n=1 Tax=Montipora capricornis TaxID=246305 RepID=UPI0035F21871
MATTVSPNGAVSKLVAAQLNMKTRSNDTGFVRPLWLTDPPIEGQESFFEGVPMVELGAPVNEMTNLRSLLHKACSQHETNGCMLNHESKLEESLLKAVQDGDLHIIQVLIDHYLQVFNLDDLLYENSVETTHKTPVNFLPLVVAAHLGKYDVLKLFISKGFKLEKPHDVLCKCDHCQEDYFRQSQKRLDVYRAMANPMWISLTGSDPFLTAFKLSQELKRSAKQEDEFEKDYLALSRQCSQFALGLLDECKTSKEQRTVLNFPGTNTNDEEIAEEALGLLHNAISYGQKEFVAHPFCQHLLMSCVFGGVPFWRTRGITFRIFYVIFQVVICPFMAILYFFCPFLRISQKIKRPFIKFVNHTASFVIFLSLLAASSHKKFEIRFGNIPSVLEWIIFMWILGIAWGECKQVRHDGILRYLSSGWNWMDMGMILLILGAYLVWFSRAIVEHFSDIDSTTDQYILSTADGLYAMGVIASFFRLVYLCQISRYLGLLQLSLSRMVRVIFQFAFISIVMLISFSVGMTMLYSSSFEAYGHVRPQRNTTDPIQDLLSKGYHSLIETMVTLMWASLDMITLDSLGVFKDQSLIQIWTAILFTLYHAASLIVLLNMLIAMMSNSYQRVEDNIETEYKFARAQLWADYIGDGVATLPPPMNLIPSPKSVVRLACRLTKKCFGVPNRLPCCVNRQFRVYEQRSTIAEQKKQLYQTVVRELISRYWARRRLPNRAPDPVNADQMAAMLALKEEVKGMLSEIGKILKTNKQNRDKGTILRAEEITLETGESSKVNGSYNHEELQPKLKKP